MINYAAVSKSLSLFSDLVGEMDMRFAASADRYINLLFDNFDTSYAEVSSHLQEPPVSSQMLSTTDSQYDCAMLMDPDVAAMAPGLFLSR